MHNVLIIIAVGVVVLQMTAAAAVERFRCLSMNLYGCNNHTFYAYLKIRALIRAWFVFNFERIVHCFACPLECA